MICVDLEGFFLGILKQLQSVDYDRWDCCLIYPKELTQLFLKPGGGELVWIDLVYIFLFCQMWGGQPAYFSVQAEPRVVL